MLDAKETSVDEPREKILEKRNNILLLQDRLCFLVSLPSSLLLSFSFSFFFLSSSSSPSSSSFLLLLLLFFFFSSGPGSVHHSSQKCKNTIVQPRKECSSRAKVRGSKSGYIFKADALNWLLLQ